MANVKIPITGKTTPGMLGTAAMRVMAKAGISGGPPPKVDPVKAQRGDIAFAKAFGMPGATDAKVQSTGRQNVPVVKQTKVASNGTKSVLPKRSASADTAAKRKRT
jgi:hypothetical protein